jgi:hypothetical protein
MGLLGPSSQSDPTAFTPVQIIEFFSPGAHATIFDPIKENFMHTIGQGGLLPSGVWQQYFLGQSVAAAYPNLFRASKSLSYKNFKVYSAQTDRSAQSASSHLLGLTDTTTSPELAATDLYEPAFFTNTNQIQKKKEHKKSFAKGPGLKNGYLPIPITTIPISEEQTIHTHLEQTCPGLFQKFWLARETLLAELFLDEKVLKSLNAKISTAGLTSLNLPEEIFSLSLADGTQKLATRNFSAFSETLKLPQLIYLYDWLSSKKHYYGFFTGRSDGAKERLYNEIYQHLTHIYNLYLYGTFTDTANNKFLTSDLKD